VTDPAMTTSDQHVLIIRVLDAPPEAVFRAWLDPDELAAWYGPDHVEVPRDRVRVDARVGGRWELTMVSRESGAEFPLGYEIIELEEPRLIVMRSDPMPAAGMHDGTLLRVEFEDHADKTRMIVHDGPYPDAGRGHAEAGWHAAFDKLAGRVAR
jgi:uncharacterized protein YndB with AHSA1/START domain